MGDAGTVTAAVDPADIFIDELGFCAGGFDLGGLWSLKTPGAVK
jgi:hypothetical protein